MTDNQQLRELFTFPPIQASTSTALVVPDMPPQKVVTGDREIDAVLWLQQVVKTGHQVLIDKALEAAKRIETPMEELAKHYAQHIARTTGNAFGAAFVSFGFGDLEDQAKRAVERVANRQEALARYGDTTALFADTPAEKACKKALRGLRREDSVFYDDAQAAERFAKHPALLPATIADCLHVRAYWDRLSWMRGACADVGLDLQSQASAHDWYCRDMLGRIPPRDGTEALAALDHLEESDSTDWETVQPIVRNLITGAWSIAEGEPA